jgi:low affinity Fe/Cu permease
VFLFISSIDAADYQPDRRSTGMWKKANEWGSRVAGRTADLAGAPLSILLVALFCGGWFLRAGQAGENTLTLILSVASITLTQMVLNGQRRSEQALHLKMDELVYAIRGARNEIAGIETKTQEELEALRRTGDAAEEVLSERGLTGSFD